LGVDNTPAKEGIEVRVVAVVVAYNRRDLLLECLDALGRQTVEPDAIVVIDNASTDGTADAVMTRFPGVRLERLAVNSGGSGGFAIGIDRAVSQHRADLVWIMDDDTIPTPNALAVLLSVRAHSAHPPAVLASRVVWTDDRDHPMNTPRRKPFTSRAESRDAELTSSVPIRSASFVSSLIDATAVRADGLPIAEYFIWNDDFEYTARLLRHRRGRFVPGSVVVHKTKARADTDADPGQRFYFEVRNKLWLFRHSKCLAWYEKPLYMAAAARRWMRTLRTSTDRRTIRRTFRSGWRDGLGTSPRPNAEYLRSIGLEGVLAESGTGEQRE
jgi:GT2 family glycosyltransferase